MQTSRPATAATAPLFPAPLLDSASRLLELCRDRGLRLATAETVTSGLVSACMTSVSGASDVVERGFVLYHSSAKATGLGVPEAISRQHGAVSAEVTRALALGLMEQSQADGGVALTGYAGPGGGNATDPVGTVFIAAADRDGAVSERRHVFEGDRDAVRLQAVQAALDLMHAHLSA